jgi:hypothetical protein
MDAFVKIKKQKNPEVFGRSKVVNTVMSYVTACETLCIYGSPGVGKTHLVKSIINGLYITPGIDFDLLAQSNSHVVVDNVDTESGLWKEIVSRQKLSKGCTLILINTIKNVDFCDCLELEPLTVEQQLNLVSMKYPTLVDKDFVMSCIKRADGNIRDLFFYLEKSDDKDVFLSPKDYIHRILSEPGAVKIGENVDDHGYSWGVVHENYSNAKNVDCVSITEDLSLADVYDTLIYEGDWDLLPFFCHHGIVKPAVEIGGTLNKECIRPGSAWTKFNNFKMRKSRVTDIKNRSGGKIDIDEIILIVNYCIHDTEKGIELMKSYGMKPQDVDIMNHISLKTKIKPKLVQYIKKSLKDALGE